MRYTVTFCAEFPGRPHKELQSRKHVTLALLWQEYKEQHPDGYQYSWFCQSYRDWTAHLDVVMRHEHRAGEKLFVDYTGQTVGLIDKETGESHKTQIFVAVLGASNYTYAEATLSQKIADWIGSHVRTFKYIGGVSEVVVPDNLKSGVSKTCRYEPGINPSYNDLAKHYQTVIIPSRSRKPRDKAKAEAGVLLVERWILAKLRKHIFFSLADLNREIRKLLVILNNRAFKKLSGSRQSRFEEIDKPALKPLPAVPYELAYWKKATVHLDYHVEVEGYYYSVPHTLVKRSWISAILRALLNAFIATSELPAISVKSLVGVMQQLKSTCRLITRNFLSGLLNGSSDGQLKSVQTRPC